MAALKEREAHRLKRKIQQKAQAYDEPVKDPEDAFTKTARDYLDTVHVGMEFGRQSPKRDISKDVQVNDRRFEPLYAISEWNGKYGSKITYNFSKLYRNTDIPGTVQPLDTKKDGPSHDIFIDCNPHLGKKSLHLGMVDMTRSAARS